MSWLKKLKTGLSKSSSKISEGISGVFTRKKLDNETLEALEDILIMADIGVAASAELVDHLRKNKFEKEVTDEEVKQALADDVAALLKPLTQPLAPVAGAAPTVILMVGVNGNGKTTTMGKLAAQLKAEGNHVMMAACDTFRAAAVEQLQIWAQRAGCVVVTGKPNQDPASVAFNALEQARQEKVDVLLIDTAGRLQNKQGLMEELAKIRRVLGKLDADAPHHTVLVLDATTGQNAHSQAKEFKALAEISGLIVTKLDGSARGGVVVALAKDYGLPLHAVGVGEGIDDLQPFDAQEFADNLMGIARLKEGVAA